MSYKKKKKKNFAKHQCPKCLGMQNTFLFANNFVLRVYKVLHASVCITPKSSLLHFLSLYLSRSSLWHYKGTV